jgi:hypothetical protein
MPICGIAYRLFSQIDVDTALIAPTFRDLNGFVRMVPKKIKAPLPRWTGSGR